jgi:hypothetical protein
MGLGSQVPRRCRVPLPGCRPTRQAARDPHIASCATANNRSGFVDLHGIRANATSTGCMPGSPPYVRCRRESLARRPFRQTLPPQHPAETHGCARDVARRAETRTRIREAAIGFERGLPRSGQSPTPSAFSPPNHGRAVSGIPRRAGRPSEHRLFAVGATDVAVHGGAQYHRAPRDRLGRVGGDTPAGAGRGGSGCGCRGHRFAGTRVRECRSSLTIEGEIDCLPKRWRP